MTIHREGTATISLVALVVGLLNIANFGEKSADNLLHEFKQKLDNISLPILMAASNKLGHGLGEERMKQIIQYYPNILFDYKKWDQTVFINNIKKISGWNDKTATLFVTNFPEFIYFYNIIKKYIKYVNRVKIQEAKLECNLYFFELNVFIRKLPFGLDIANNLILKPTNRLKKNEIPSGIYMPPLSFIQGI